MLLHKGIGLDTFNALPRSRAVHALYECCCCVTWAQKVADARPFASYADLLNTAEEELGEVSPSDVDRAFDGCVHERISAHTLQELSSINRDRLAAMLGPEEGYPDFG
ncbi:OHCU decarboxylase [Skermania sp. ID1734]|uniref:2-oxo-4-hydroxy-4-carboxy-5-ureidoimidazoline decarboxylase n=1 Tax=Skermania sp. ID1734 TaxID=2597516 RepID=UPI00117F9BC8|nr:2-oxo-4-hydroxy-4-carboxy-5-ureidoimidazoline decarboxylase [Skermania sp. ID1734]TSD95587.1 OHCU decarboxylase [Skermania sp. ID1734]